MFKSARLKLDRADKHISDLDSAIRRMPNAYTATIKKDIESRKNIVEYELHDCAALEQLGLIIGDAIHNIHCALDHAWVGTIGKLVPSQLDGHTKFPARETREGLEGGLHGREIDSLCPELYRRMVLDIKPYDGGNVAIWPIHELDIKDKHILLLPLISVVSVSGVKLEDNHGEICEQSLWTIESSGRFTLPMEGNFKLKDKGEMSLQVAFNKGLPAEGLEVLGTLSLFAKVVLNVVELLEQVSA